MKLLVENAKTPIAIAWATVLADVVVRHPDPMAEPELTILDGPPRLQVAVLDSADTLDPAAQRRRLVIGTCTLTCFPGVDLARKWIAAIWAGYAMHEALELVTVGDFRTKVLDPHAEPFECDAALRRGMPVVLTPESLEAALAVVMTKEAAARSMTACR